MTLTKLRAQNVCHPSLHVVRDPQMEAMMNERGGRGAEPKKVATQSTRKAPQGCRKKASAANREASKRLTCRCRKNDPKASPTDILAKSFLLQLIPVARDFTDVGVPERPRNWGDTSNCEYEAHVPAQSWYLDWPQFPVVVRLVQVDRPDSLSWPAPMPGNMVALWGSQTFGVTSRVRLEVISRQLHVGGKILGGSYVIMAFIQDHDTFFGVLNTFNASNHRCDIDTALFSSIKGA
ncbi:hypothetical protein BKA64DRAFT_647224 [Cadophora sp. MPI-SDFR-AT-0126]|nr:hypothetical protein BKA64DRAFT_647224 [Leotiomycetes sp. MPI-SDFR-AT-0126]